MKRFFYTILSFFALVAALTPTVGAQQTHGSVERGSLTAKQGFRNETEIAGKFNSWRTDDDARAWLTFMGFKPADVRRVTATKPHGEKADVEVRVTTPAGDKVEGISIKLVSSAYGFNQIDKRWLSHYAKMWQMPADVVEPLRFFVGEEPPNRPSRNADRMYLNEFDATTQKRIIDFFASNREKVVADLFAGDGVHSARWILVALKASETPRWALRSIEYAERFYGAGPIVITRAGNLKIGRITMQRKGGDGGRDSAKMLQFKIDPTQLFDK